MKNRLFLIIIVVASLFSPPAFSQNVEDSIKTLGMAGDNLDLYAVLSLFQKSKTIEGFEKDLNLKETGINNLDLNLDKKVDFIKVVTEQNGESFTFILQVDVSKTETQDVASILVDKDKNDKISLQIVGAEALYGKDYVIEPKGNSSVTANPAYQGEDPVTVNVPATTTVLVQSPPVVQYVYSPAYVPYYPPYYYGFYPVWHVAFTAMAIGMYQNACYHYHGGYYGGHYGGGNTVIINNGNRNNINHNTSNIVNNNSKNGIYGDGRGNSNRNSARNRSSSVGNRASTSNRAGASTRPSTGSGSNRASASTRQSGGMGTSSANRPTTSNYSSNRKSTSSASRSMSSGGGRTMSGGGMSRGGGGGGRRR